MTATRLRAREKWGILRVRVIFKVDLSSTTPRGLALAAIVGVASACSTEPPEPEKRRPEQAGQRSQAVEAAAHILRARANATLGNGEGTRESIEAASESYRKAIRLADPSKAVDRELARTAAKRVDGVRSVVWLDSTNLFAMVEQNAQRSQDTIDSICIELEPLGDTLGVVVNLQSSAATNGDELEILARNCQLAPGERALLQRERKVDVIDPAVRAQHKANQDPARR